MHGAGWLVWELFLFPGLLSFSSFHKARAKSRVVLCVCKLWHRLGYHGNDERMDGPHARDSSLNDKGIVIDHFGFSPFNIG